MERVERMWEREKYYYIGGHSQTYILNMICAIQTIDLSEAIVSNMLYYLFDARTLIEEPTYSLLYLKRELRTLYTWDPLRLSHLKERSSFVPTKIDPE